MVVIGGAGTLGQLSNALFHWGFWNFTGMAIHTALGFVFLGAGMFSLIREEHALRWALDGPTTLGFLVAVLTMLTVAAFTWSYTYRLQGAGKLVSHSTEELRQIENIRAGMANLESGQRGYIITGDTTLLASRDDLHAAVHQGIVALHQLVADDPVQRQQLDDLEQKVAQRAAFGDETIQLRQTQGFAAAQAKIATGVGITLTKAIDDLLTAMRESEYSKFLLRQQDVDARATSTFLLLPSGIILSLTILSLAVFFLNAGLVEEKVTRDKLGASLKEVTYLKYALDEHSIVAFTDPKGRITYVNDKFCEISKYSRSELLGLDHRIINSGYHGKEFIRDLWATISQGDVWHGEIKNRAKDGSYYWVDTTIVPFVNDEGNPLRYVAIRTDISERKIAEEASRLLAAIVNSSNDAIIGKDLTSIITSWNMGAERLFGYTAAEMIGQSILRLIPTERRGEEDTIIERVKKGESVEPFETQRVAKDGHLIDISVTVSPIKDKDGRIVGASKVARDITEQKQARQALHAASENIRELNVTLEKRVADRTAELEAANKELEAFSYSVSHDLRAPLRAVDGFSQAVLEDCASILPEQGRKDLETIRAAAQRMGHLIDDLLAFSRLGRAPLKVRQVDVNQLVEGVLQELSPQHEGRKIEIMLKKLPDCLGDPALLKQVWVNLLSNAIKYTSKAPAAVIEIGARAEGSQTVYFVRDNGAGFDMRYAQKLFGVFQRLHRLDEFEGTGVGLAIVQRVIHRHGGLIWADAKPNFGATFHFTLNGENPS
jgi:PAS domain S-box-containing protein